MNEWEYESVEKSIEIHSFVKTNCVVWHLTSPNGARLVIVDEPYVVYIFIAIQRLNKY